MGVGLGILGKVATGVESTYGTAVTTDRFVGFDSFGLKPIVEILESNSLGLNAGVNLRKGPRRTSVARRGEGPITMECVTNGQGRWWQQFFGGTSTIVQQGATPAWLQTHQLDTQTGKSMTIQGQYLDELAAEVESFTFLGCKLTKASFANTNKDRLRVTFDVDARDFSTAIAMAAFSAPVAAAPFHFKQALIKVGGAQVATVRDWTVEVMRALDVGRFHAGSAGLKKEPITNDFPSASGKLTAEFDSPVTYYDLAVADTATDLIIEYTGALISGANFELLRLTVPEIHFTDASPTMGGPGLVIPDVNWIGQSNAAGTKGVKLEIMSTDTSL